MKKALAKAFLYLVTVSISLWIFGALEYLPTLSEWMRDCGLVLLAVSLLGVFVSELKPSIKLGPLKLKSGAYSSLFFLFSSCLVSFLLVKPSNDREWEPSVALTSVAKINGDLITVYNIRNFDYRSESDFTPRYYSKTFDLNAISSVDLITSYWAGDSIAHIMVSFGFHENDFVTFSIETRKESNESYSTFAGFFRNYELAYLVADERDVIGLRTKIRQPNERVYLWRLKASQPYIKKFFMEYIHSLNALSVKPDFYNTLTTNCTTQVLWLAQANDSSLAYTWRVLMSGYVPQFLYESEVVDTSVSFSELRAKSYINDKANLDLVGDDFSRRIRVGVPTPSPY